MQLRKAEHTGNHTRKPDEWRYYPEVSARRAADTWCRNHFMRIDSTWLGRRPYMPPMSIKRVFEPISQKIRDVTRPSGHPGEFCSARLDTHCSSHIVPGHRLSLDRPRRHLPPGSGKISYWRTGPHRRLHLGILREMAHGRSQRETVQLM